MQMVYQVKENTEDIRQIKEDNKKFVKELDNLKKSFDDIAKYNKYLQEQLNLRLKKEQEPPSLGGNY